MRVLLPLRKLPASNRSSSSCCSSSSCSSSESLEDLQRVAAEEHERETLETEQVSTEHNQANVAPTVSPSEGPWSPGVEIGLDVSVDSIPGLEQKRSSVPSKKGATKTTGLAPSESLSASRKRPANVPRKRPRISLSAIEDNLERPVVSDQKPAAKPSAERMGLGPPNQSMSPVSWGPECGMNDPPLSLSPSTTTDSSDDDPVMISTSRKMPARRRSDDGATLLFVRELKQQRGLEIREQEGDGNCLFRAVSLQVYGDSSMHGQVRKQCMDFMVRMVEKELYDETQVSLVVWHDKVEEKTSHALVHDRSATRNTFLSLSLERISPHIYDENAEMESMATILRFKQLVNYSTGQLRYSRRKMAPRRSIFFMPSTRLMTRPSGCPIMTEITTMQ